jgi:beta-propeller repeat-containing protein
VAGEQNWANAVAADVVGDVYICGSSFQPCYGGSEGGCDTFQSNYGWIVKYSARGDLLWQQTFGFEARGVTTDRNGNVYVVWSANGAFVSKMSPLGRVIWQRPLGSRYLGWSAATDGDGNVYVSGGSGYSISGEAFVAKLSRSGTLQWTRKLGTPRRDWASATATDSDGNVYISGYTEGSLGGAAKGDVDAWLASYSAAGALRWKRQLGTAQYDTATGIGTDSNGNLYVSGTTEGSLAGANKGGSDAWLAKYYTRR